MKRRGTIGARRRIAFLFTLPSLALLLIFAVLIWVVMTGDDLRALRSSGGPPELNGPPQGELQGDLPPDLWDDGGPGNRNGPPGASRSDSDGARNSRRPSSLPPKAHPGHRQRVRFTLSVCGIGFLVVISVAIFVWHAVSVEFERGAAQSGRFTADVAHELKTPLAVMQSMVEHAIRHADGNEGVERLGADVLEEVSRLKSLVTRLLLLAQSDSGKLPLKREKVDLSALAKLLAEDLSLLTGDDPVEAKIADGISVTADRSFLTQALQNILSNAAKYNRPGFTIDFSLAPEGKNAVITVSNGVDPLAPPDVDKIFDRFYRGDTARGSKLEGAGLGLSLAKEIVEASGGSIAAAIDGDRIVIRTELPRA